MTHFARKLRYAANDGENGVTYAALVELANKKGGPPKGFVLYWRILRNPPGKCESKMIRLKTNEAKNVDRFWLGGAEFPGWQGTSWEKTTPWLDRVALGYSGVWMRVGTPNHWAKRRKKKPAKFGDLGWTLRERQARLNALEMQKQDLVNSLDVDDDNDDDGEPFTDVHLTAETEAEIERLEEAILDAQNAIEATEQEMQFRVRQMFPEPLGKTPRRVLREQTEGVLRASRW